MIGIIVSKLAVILDPHMRKLQMVSVNAKLISQ